MRREVQLSSTPDLPTIVYEGAKGFVQANPRISLAYVVGILVCVFGQGLTPPEKSIIEMNQAVESAHSTLGIHLDRAHERKEQQQSLLHIWILTNSPIL